MPWVPHPGPQKPDPLNALCNLLLQDSEWTKLYTFSNNTKDPRLVRACFRRSLQLHRSHAVHLSCDCPESQMHFAWTRKASVRLSAFRPATAGSALHSLPARLIVWCGKVQKPKDMDWMFYPDPKLHLKLQQLQLLRRHLFGDSAAALSDRLTDVELVQLLIVSIGRQLLDCARVHARLLEAVCWVL